MSTAQDITLGSLILLIGALIISGSLLYFRRTLIKNFKRVTENFERTTENYQAEVTQLRQEHANEIARITEGHTYARERLTRDRDQCAVHVQSLEESVAKLSSALAATAAHLDAKRRREWMQDLQKEPPRNEHEAEIRVGYPLLKMMGFKDSSIKLQYPVRIPAASANFTAFVHFAVFNENNQTSPHLFLYVTAPGASAHQGIIQQVRSYARLEGCKFFIITDGAQLQVYERTLVSDDPVDGIHGVTTLIEQWDNLMRRLHS